MITRIATLTLLAVLTAGCATIRDPYYGCDDPRKSKDGLCRGADGQLHRAGQGNFVWSGGSAKPEAKP